MIGFKLNYMNIYDYMKICVYVILYENYMFASTNLISISFISEGVSMM